VINKETTALTQVYISADNFSEKIYV